MKTILPAFLLALSLNSFAETPSLFVRDGRKLIDVAKLLSNGEDVQASYGFENFCYKGEAQPVINLIKRWNKSGDFFSGGGGGFELKSVVLIRGFVTYDIRLNFEDEVIPGEFTSINVKPCSWKP